MIKSIIIALRLIAAFVSNDDTNPNMIPVTCYGTDKVPCAYTEVTVGDGVVGYYTEGADSDEGFYVCKIVPGNECMEAITPADGALYQAAILLCNPDSEGKYTDCVTTPKEVKARIKNASIPD